MQLKAKQLRTLWNKMFWPLENVTCSSCSITGVFVMKCAETVAIKALEVAVIKYVMVRAALAITEAAVSQSDAGEEEEKEQAFHSYHIYSWRRHTLLWEDVTLGRCVWGLAVSPLAYCLICFPSFHCCRPSLCLWVCLLARLEGVAYCSILRLAPASSPPAIAIVSPASCSSSTF